MLSRSRIIHEKIHHSTPIKIPNSNENLQKLFLESVVPKFMDPTMNSPPNGFMQKLHSRMAILFEDTDIVNDKRVRT